jgi:hypothetical protein
MSETNKDYIVRRLLVDGDKSGDDIVAYVKVATPRVGELVYHGDFVKRRIQTQDNGPMGCSYQDVYVPVDPSKITSEPYNGGEEVETF